MTPGERLFYSTIKTEATTNHYRFFLRKYLEMYNYDYESPDQILIKQPQDIENEIVDCIITLKGKGMKRATIKNYIYPVIKFCRANRVRLNSDIFEDHLPKRTKPKDTGGYSDEQIQQMLRAADPRMRCVILLLSSTGMRIGALPSLTFGNLEETKSGLYKITIYEGEEEQYITFCTPECKQAIIDYKEYRQRYGEVIKKTSPLIREQFDKRDSLSIKHPKPITDKLLIVTLTVLLESIGIRKRVELVDGQKASTVRSNVPLCNGFRRFFTSQLINSNCNDLKRYLMEGHALRYNDASYAHVDKTLEQEYLKAVPKLTINPENRLNIEVKELKEGKISEKDKEIQLLRDRLSDVEKRAFSPEGAKKLEEGLERQKEGMDIINKKIRELWKKMSDRRALELMRDPV
jgi:integrase